LLREGRCDQSSIKKLRSCSLRLGWRSLRKHQREEKELNGKDEKSKKE